MYLVSSLHIGPYPSWASDTLWAHKSVEKFSILSHFTKWCFGPELWRNIEWNTLYPGYKSCAAQQLHSSFVAPLSILGSAGVNVETVIWLINRLISWIRGLPYRTYTQQGEGGSNNAPNGRHSRSWNPFLASDDIWRPQKGEVWSSLGTRFHNKQLLQWMPLIADKHKYCRQKGRGSEIPKKKWT